MSVNLQVGNSLGNAARVAVAVSASLVLVYVTTPQARKQVHSSVNRTRRSTFPADQEWMLSFRTLSALPSKNQSQEWASQGAHFGNLLAVPPST